MPDDSGVVPEWWTTHARNPDRALPGGIFASTDFRGDGRGRLLRGPSTVHLVQRRCGDG